MLQAQRAAQSWQQQQLLQLTAAAAAGLCRRLHADSVIAELCCVIGLGSSSLSRVRGWMSV